MQELTSHIGEKLDANAGEESKPVKKAQVHNKVNVEDLKPVEEKEVKQVAKA